jgi:hypothetical protein
MFNAAEVKKPSQEQKRGRVAITTGGSRGDLSIFDSK